MGKLWRTGGAAMGTTGGYLELEPCIEADLISDGIEKVASQWNLDGPEERREFNGGSAESRFEDAWILSIPRGVPSTHRWNTDIRARCRVQSSDQSKHANMNSPADASELCVRTILIMGYDKSE